MQKKKKKTVTLNTFKQNYFILDCILYIYKYNLYTHIYIVDEFTTYFNII